MKSQEKPAKKPAKDNLTFKINNCGCGKNLWQFVVSRVTSEVVLQCLYCTGDYTVREAVILKKKGKE